MQGRRPAAEGDRVTGADPFGEAPLELVDPRALGDHRIPQRRGDGLHVALVDLLAPKPTSR